MDNTFGEMYDNTDGRSILYQPVKDNKPEDACSWCGFKDWTPGHIKYFKGFEAHGSWEEHLCPPCADLWDLPVDPRHLLQYQNSLPDNRTATSKAAPAARTLSRKRNFDCFEEDENDRYREKWGPVNTQYVDGDDCSVLAAMTTLAKAQGAPCSLRPHPTCSLFVAWNGVLVLVFEGFPNSLIYVKECIEKGRTDRRLSHPMVEERPGSKWPKTALAAVFNDAPDLSVEELHRLCNICKEYSRRITSSTDTGNDVTGPRPPRPIQIPILTVSYVHSTCRSLEHFQVRNDNSLATTFLREFHKPILPYTGPISEEEKARVNSVVEEWLDEVAYLPKVNQPGSRMSSYRTLATSTTADNGKSSFVAFLDPLPELLRQHLVDFRIAVDTEFPGRYGWFAEKSLHVTLRSLELTGTPSKIT